MLNVVCLGKDIYGRQRDVFRLPHASGSIGEWNHRVRSRARVHNLKCRLSNAVRERQLVNGRTARQVRNGLGRGFGRRLKCVNRRSIPQLVKQRLRPLAKMRTDIENHRRLDRQCRPLNERLAVRRHVVCAIEANFVGDESSKLRESRATSESFQPTDGVYQDWMAHKGNISPPACGNSVRKGSAVRASDLDRGS